MKVQVNIKKSQTNGIFPRENVFFVSGSVSMCCYSSPPTFFSPIFNVLSLVKASFVDRDTNGAENSQHVFTILTEGYETLGVMGHVVLS